jgi:hypothetical protein
MYLINFPKKEDKLLELCGRFDKELSKIRIFTKNSQTGEGVARVADFDVPIGCEIPDWVCQKIAESLAEARDIGSNHQNLRIANLLGFAPVQQRNHWD